MLTSNFWYVILRYRREAARLGEHKQDLGPERPGDGAGGVLGFNTGVRRVRYACVTRGLAVVTFVNWQARYGPRCE